MSDEVARMKEKVVTISVGKNGITENLINEINLQLEKRGVVKVRMLKNFRSHSGKSKDEIVEEIASKVKGKVIDFRGFVLTLERC
ncbi:MAG: YhbY family RNA-binding protein [Archaeoglobales archaeon]|nr:YhbY family RNA-binding protein [Archaeoglobales archaeon]